MAARIEITVDEEHFPRYDPAHGTPDPMVRRVALIRLPEGEAKFEQTDYGHPGRFNDWEPRGVAPKLQAKTEALRALCGAASKVLG
jgi:hypothetical protein